MHFDPIEWLTNALLQKTFRDNLPSLHWKNILRFLKRAVACIACIGFVLLLIARVYLLLAGKTSKAQQGYAGILMILAVSVIVWYKLYLYQLKAAAKTAQA